MQVQKVRFGIMALALSALGSLFGCSKDELQQVAPQGEGKATPTAQQLNWQQFTAKVEAGQLADPFGQYVSKDTWVSSDGGVRPGRPKRATDLQGRSLEGGSVESKFIQPEEPCDGCGGGGGPYVPPYTFVTSENRGASYANPSGSILDMKIVTANWSSWQFPGYTKLEADLNKGVGGEYIYFSFTRDPGSVQFASPIPLTLISILSRSTGRPSTPDNHEPLWYGQNTTGTPTVSQLDLNDGAGGDYIFSYISRNTGYGAPIKEVGVLSSRNAAQMPPAGWERVGVDLNKGAGGDYIYVCVKR